MTGIDWGYIYPEEGCAECKKLKAELKKLEAKIAILVEWTHQYGKELCPPRADTYGEGVRDCKEKVRRILTTKEEE